MVKLNIMLILMYLIELSAIVFCVALALKYFYKYKSFRSMLIFIGTLMFVQKIIIIDFYFLSIFKVLPYSWWEILYLLDSKVYFQLSAIGISLVLIGFFINPHIQGASATVATSAGVL